MPNRFKIIFFGFGAMGGALARAWISSKALPARDITAVTLEPSKRAALARQLRVRLTKDIPQELSKAGLIFLAVKPQQLKALLGQVGGLFPGKALVISLAAGVPTSRIEEWLPQGCPVVRVMPNTPSLLGAGMAGVSAGKRATPAQLKKVLGLFSKVGRALAVDEGLMDLVTAISGSGPAYVFRFIEALVAAGVKRGLPPSQAGELAAQTLYGAALMALRTGKTPQELRIQVTSPGGTTQAGLAALDGGGFLELVDRTVEAAERRGAELREMNR